MSIQLIWTFLPYSPQYVSVQETRPILFNKKRGPQAPLVKPFTFYEVIPLKTTSAGPVMYT